MKYINENNSVFDIFLLQNYAVRCSDVNDEDGSIVCTCRAMAYQAPDCVDVNVKVQLEIFPRLVTVPRGQTSPHSSTPYGLLIKKKTSVE